MITDHTMSNKLSLTLHFVRSHERMDYKRCPKKWYWKWRMGLVPKAISFGALDLGTWMHSALAYWYGVGFDRNGDLAEHFMRYANSAIGKAEDANAPGHVIDSAQELAALGEAMATAYQKYYEDDPSIDVLDVEIPLEFTFTDGRAFRAIHKLKPDLVYYDPSGNGDIWLMEHKTTAQIRTGHLPIDDQARPYGTMAERALRNAGLIDKSQKLKGIMYNFLRKALPDLRPIDKDGRSLNKDGSVSKKQPALSFVRHPVTLTLAAKRKTLLRVQSESALLALLTQRIRSGHIHPDDIPKTPHNSCPKTCQFFEMCVTEENGGNIEPMRRSMYTRKDPYEYYEETTDEPPSFEMG